MKKLLIFLAVILVFVVGCETVEMEEGPKVKEEELEIKETEPLEPEIGFAGITEQQCKEADGHWNRCGSPCAGLDADFCIQVCQVQCECSGIAGFSCPEGFKCRLTGNIADEIGVCVRS
jgi:hypothetical protein